jgi:hypothetical protein
LTIEGLLSIIDRSGNGCQENNHMKCIFVDNFRGFRETLLPIKDVNFFVGENSTGKTSLLALLNLFHSPNFWALGEFSSGEIEPREIDLGNYEDMVSIHPKDKTYFHVGALSGLEKGRRDKYEAFLMTFSESRGMPKIRRYTVVTDNKKADIKFKGQKALCQIKKAESITEDYSSVKKLFMRWLRNHRKETSGFKELKGLRFPRGVGSAGAVNVLIQAIIRGEPISPRTLRFELAYPVLYQRLIWLAPIRTKPQPIYSRYDTPFSPEGHHTPYSIKRLLESKETAEDFKTFVEKFGRQSGLFDSVNIRQYEYGGRKVAPFEVDIVLSGAATKITNVGYGVSQALPIIVELFTGRKGSAYTIQQPEIHLHPIAQAALGDLFFRFAAMDNKKFIVETHSDFIIDRFRMNFRNSKENKKPESQIIYFENSSEGNVLSVLDIDEEGNLPKDQPRGYREFFLKEDLRTLGY